MGLQSNKSSSMTVRLQAKDYIMPNINFIERHLNINFNDKRANNTSRVSSNYSIELTQNLPEKEEFTIRKKEKILIIDDNHFITEATKNVLLKVLSEAGSDIEVIVGSDGADMINYVIQDQSNGNEIKCILTDENMEYINGSDAIRIIRNLENLNKIKFINIISVTGNEESACTNEILSAGAQLILNKPLAKSVIKRVLADLNLNLL